MSDSDQPPQPPDAAPGALPDGSTPQHEAAAARHDPPAEPAGDPPYELSESDFLTAQPPPPPLTPPGPGLPEAIAWTAGTILVHVLAVVILLSGVFLLHAGRGGRVPWPDGLSLEKVLETVDAAILFGGEQLVFVVVAASLAVVRLRMTHNHYALEERKARERGWTGRRTGPGRLSLDRIAPGHVALILGLVLPVALLATKGQQVFAEAWNRLAESIPGMEQVENARVVEQLLKALEGVSLPALVLILAVLPALGEEIVFRGVVGRGLTARWGLVAGVLLTSFLFAIVHLDLVHAVGVFPLGIAIHLVYVATRSFWAPVLYHFLNNSIAAAGLWAAGRLPEDPLAAGTVAADPPEMPLFVYVAAALCVVSLAMLLWRTRSEYIRDDGTLWTPGYDTAEAPPESIEAVRVCRRAEAGYYVFATVGVLAFIAALGWAMWPAA